MNIGINIWAIFFSQTFIILQQLHIKYMYIQFILIMAPVCIFVILVWEETRLSGGHQPARLGGPHINLKVWAQSFVSLTNNW